MTPMAAKAIELLQVLGFLGLWMGLTVLFFLLITYPLWSKKLFKKKDG